MKNIDIGTLNLSKKHIAKVIKVLKSNRLSYGQMTEEFEKKLSKLHGNKYGIFTNSGTSALQVTLHAMKILYGWKDGDEVIMPATTFVATYNVIVQNKLKPVLVDVGTDFNINSKLIEKKINKKTRVILPVHLLGKPCDMKQIMKLARKYNLKVVEDSCETMGVKGVGKGDVTCFSFYVAHLLITGVGGMAITNNKKLAELIRSLIFHGRNNKYLKIDDDDKYSEKIIHSRFKFNHPGYSYRGTEVEAALGLVELNELDKNIKQRQSNAFYLNCGLYNHLPMQYLENHAFMMYPMLLKNRNKVMLELEKRGITTRTIMPLINQPYIKVKTSVFPVSEMILANGLLVGCHQGLKKNDLDFIIKIVKQYAES